VSSYPLVGVDDRAYEIDNAVTAVGWGAVNSEGDLFENYLRKVDFPIVPNSECNAIGRDVRYYFCAGISGRDSCFGDSGGPIYAEVTRNETEEEPNNIVIGIVNFGTSKDCTGTYGGYLRLSDHVEWFETATEFPEEQRYRVTSWLLPESEYDASYDDGDTYYSSFDAGSSANTHSNTGWLAWFLAFLF
jgi:secreted trypsin-like serine protease